MNVWLITIGEPLPIDGPGIRSLRAGILANFLTLMNHTVLWWTSTFNHKEKKHRFCENKIIKISEHFSIHLLYAPAYHKNVSIGRMLNHRALAKQFSKFSECYERPDIIVCSLPVPELCFAASTYATRHQVPMVLDIRDLWPDCLLEFFPSKLQLFVKPVLSNMYKQVKFSCSNAAAITGCSPDFVKWGLQFAGRTGTPFDKHFPFAYISKKPEDKEIQKAMAFWDSLGIGAKKEEFLICFFGNFGRYFDIKFIVQVAKKLVNINKNIKFILCGIGEYLPAYQRMTQGYSNIIFPGWISSVEIWTLMRMSSIGLAPYKDTQTFCTGLSNKVIEYLSAGLPILSSFQDGPLKHMLKFNNCGVTYKNGALDETIEIILRLYDNPIEREIMVRNCFLLYKEQFMAEKVYPDIVTYLQEVATVFKNKWLIEALPGKER